MVVTKIQLLRKANLARTALEKGSYTVIVWFFENSKEMVSHFPVKELVSRFLEGRGAQMGLL